MLFGGRDTLDGLGTFCMWLTSKFNITFQIGRDGLYGQVSFLLLLLFFFLLIYVLTLVGWTSFTNRVIAAKDIINHKDSWQFCLQTQQSGFPPWVCASQGPGYHSLYK